MPRPTARTLAQAFRHRADVEAAAAAPLSGRVASALSGSAAALRVIEAGPAHLRQPAVVLAALYDLALAGRAPALAAAYATADGDAAAAAAVDTVLGDPDGIATTALRRPLRTDESGRHAVLYPVIAEAARRVGAESVGLVDLGRPAALNLVVDRVGVTFGDGPAVGDPRSLVRLTASVVGRRPVPTRPLPRVVARVGVDRDPLDVTDADDARWLRACAGPDRPEQVTAIEAEIALAAATPPLLLRGDPVEVLPQALAQVPTDALPVVTTTWALSRLSPANRLRLLHRLDEAATDRAVAWVSAEGVGVAPGVPTLGDRRASGHSILGLAVFRASALHTEAVGRCWSRGRALAWLAEPG